MRGGSPVPLELHRFIVFAEPRMLEIALHGRFAEFRRHGEWFDRSVLREIDGQSDSQVLAATLQLSLFPVST
jgi:hypothetical protein